MGLLFRIKHSLLPLHQKSARKLHELKYIFFELTHKCNANCLHCGSDCIKDSETPDLRQDAILKVLEEIKDHYDSHRITVVLSGGEPLCYPDVFKLGRRITGLEYPWGMVTNGYAWTYQKIQEAKRAGLQTITVSLDGLEEDHDWLRGHKNSFRRAVGTIEMLVKNRFWQAMDVVTCVNRRNIQKLDELYEFIKNLGVERWRLFTISPIGRAVCQPDLFLDQQEFVFLMDRIRELKKRKEIFLNYSESGYLGPKLELCVRDQQYFCRAGINVAGIMVNGDILACPNIDRRFKQGNIYRDSFVDVWESKYQIFRDRSWMRVAECEKCSEWKFCQGNSFHLWDVDNNCTKLCYCKRYGLMDIPDFP